jgi:hypothetical protein
LETRSKRSISLLRRRQFPSKPAQSSSSPFVCTLPPFPCHALTSLTRRLIVASSSKHGFTVRKPPKTSPNERVCDSTRASLERRRFFKLLTTENTSTTKRTRRMSRMRCRRRGRGGRGRREGSEGGSLLLILDILSTARAVLLYLLGDDVKKTLFSTDPSPAPCLIFSSFRLLSSLCCASRRSTGRQINKRLQYLVQRKEESRVEVSGGILVCARKERREEERATRKGEDVGGRKE